LQIAESDFDDQLGPHVDRPAVVANLARLQLLRLPFEQRVGQSLERLAQHHVFAGRRVERAEVQVRELAGAPPVAPFRCEHDEIQRVHALDLEPARAAIAGFVGRIERLRHQSFVARRKCGLVELLRRVRRAG